MFRKAALYQKHPQNATLNSGALPHERDPRNACYHFFPIIRPFRVDAFSWSSALSRGTQAHHTAPHPQIQQSSHTKKENVMLNPAHEVHQAHEAQNVQIQESEGWRNCRFDSLQAPTQTGSPTMICCYWVFSRLLDLLIFATVNRRRFLSSSVMRERHCWSFLKYRASFPDAPHNFCPAFPPVT